MSAESVEYAVRVLEMSSKYSTEGEADLSRSRLKLTSEDLKSIFAPNCTNDYFCVMSIDLRNNNITEIPEGLRWPHYLSTLYVDSEVQRLDRIPRSIRVIQLRTTQHTPTQEQGRSAVPPAKKTQQPLSDEQVWEKIVAKLAGRGITVDELERYMESKNLKKEEMIQSYRGSRETVRFRRWIKEIQEQKRLVARTSPILYAPQALAIEDLDDTKFIYKTGNEKGNARPPSYLHGLNKRRDSICEEKLTAQEVWVTFVNKINLEDRMYGKYFEKTLEYYKKKIEEGGKEGLDILSMLAIQVGNCPTPPNQFILIDTVRLGREGKLEGIESEDMENLIIRVALEKELEKILREESTLLTEGVETIEYLQGIFSKLDDYVSSAPTFPKVSQHNFTPGEELKIRFFKHFCKTNKRGKLIKDYRGKYIWDSRKVQVIKEKYLRENGIETPKAKCMRLLESKHRAVRKDDKYKYLVSDYPGIKELNYDTWKEDLEKRIKDKPESQYEKEGEKLHKEIEDKFEELAKEHIPFDTLVDRYIKKLREENGDYKDFPWIKNGNYKAFKKLLIEKLCDGVPKDSEEPEFLKGIISELVEKANTFVKKQAESFLEGGAHLGELQEQLQEKLQIKLFEEAEGEEHFERIVNEFWWDTAVKDYKKYIKHKHWVAGIRKYYISEYEKCLKEEYPYLSDAKRWINAGQGEENPDYKEVSFLEWFRHGLETILKDETDSTRIKRLAKQYFLLAKRNATEHIEQAYQHLITEIEKQGISRQQLEGYMTNKYLSQQDVLKKTQTEAGLLNFIREILESQQTQPNRTTGLQEQEINTTDDTTLERTPETDEEQQPPIHDEAQPWYKQYTSILLSSFTENIRTAKALALILFESLKRRLPSSSNSTNERRRESNDVVVFVEYVSNGDYSAWESTSRSMLQNRTFTGGVRNNNTGGTRPAL